MTSVSQRLRLPHNASFRKASHLVGTLDADGTAVIERDLASYENGAAKPVLKKRSSHDSASSTGSNGDKVEPDPSSVAEGSCGGGLTDGGKLRIHRYESLKTENETGGGGAGRGRPLHRRRKSITITLEKTGENGKYYLNSDDPEVRELLQNAFERTAEGQLRKKRSKFSDIVFTRQFTAFDRQNVESARSPFHGFFTLFWMGVSLLLVKIAANNWRQEGSIFGRNEIVQMMVKRDLLLLGITDGVMCGITIICLPIQKLVFSGWLNWDRSGWIIQSIWQIFYLTSFIGWTRYREWPWTHSILIALHCITMLMKQHSYAFYNGHLSQVYKRRQILLAKLKNLEDSDVFDTTSPPRSPESTSATSFLNQGDLAMLHRRRLSMNKATKETHDLDEDISNVTSAIEHEGTSLSVSQAKSLRRLMKWEIDRLSEELRGKCTVTENHYPRNLNWKDFYGYIPLPTLVYELEYPRQEKISWSYILEKTIATFGIIGVMIMVSTAFIYPVVVHTVTLKELGIPLRDRLREFPLVFMDLLFPLLMEQLLSWYLIWECVLNVFAEVTRFADRGFYSDWWNSTSWDYYARTWNVPVHNFLLRHAYHSSISSWHLSRSSATLVTFVLSACVHELVMMVLFGKVGGYLFLFQMMQLPLVSLSRSRLLRGRDTLGNVVFWLGLSIGPSVLTSLYLFI